MASVAEHTGVVLPSLADGMEEGTLLRWLVADGAAVSAGEAIVEVETDKASTELEAEADGVLSHRAAEGETVAVGTVIAIIADEHVPADRAPEPAPAPGSESVSAAADTSASPDDGRVNGRGIRLAASPLARRIAREHRLDLAGVTGSGPRGRVIRADVLAVLEGGTSPTAVPAPPPAASSSDARGTAEHVTLTRLQSAVARRMVESKATQPDFAISVDVDMDAAVRLREQLRDEAKALGVAAFSYNDMVVKAAALALRRFPRANASFVDGSFVLHSRVNVGVAVAAADALVVPTVFDADRKSLTAIGATVKDLAAKVRDGKAAPAELDGGTFTVSNLGMFGVSRFTAVLNPPQAAILAVGALTTEPVVRDGEIVVGQRMSLTLTCDHRILYGAQAAEFLAHVRSLLESPWSLVLQDA